MAPKSPQTLFNDAQNLEKSGDIGGAIKIYKTFLSKHRSHPNALKVRIRAAQMSVMIGQYDNAVTLIRNAGGAGESDLKCMYTLAQACAYAGRLDEANDALQKALGIDPDYPPAIARLATIMQYEGRSDEAIKILNDAHGRGIDSWDLDLTLGELAPKADRVDEAVERIQRRLTDKSIKDAPRIELEYLLASLLERQGNYTEAWEAAYRGGSLKTSDGMGGYSIKGAAKNKPRTNIDAEIARFKSLMDIFDVETLKTLEPTDSGPEQRPHILMISGMPRSGTTLIEQILSAHPLAESAGEAPFLIKAANECKMYPNPSTQFLSRISRNKRNKMGQQVLDQLRELSGSSEYVVDKHPSNDEHIGFLAAIAPGAKMILTRRDPREIALSCFFRNFARGHGWTNEFDAVVDMIEIRFQMHDHWLKVIPEGAPWLNLTTGDYTKIVSNPEAETRRLVEFAGLPWDDACLNFSKRKRIVPTLQPHQAAQGIYKGSVAKWTPYAELMGSSLDRLNAICEKYDYPV